MTFILFSPSSAKSKELDYLNGKKVKCIFTSLWIFVVFAIILWLLYWLKLIGNASCGHCLGDYITTKEEEEAKDLAKMKETEEKLKKMKDWVENNALDQLNVIVEHVNPHMPNQKSL